MEMAGVEPAWRKVSKKDLHV